MVADYLLAGKKWSGPREGVNLAGYVAWAVGFIVGILPLDVLPITLSPEMKQYVAAGRVYSFIVGFVVYFALAKAGLQPKSVAMPKAAYTPSLECDARLSATDDRGSRRRSS